MKKIFLLLTTVLSLATMAMAQTPGSGEGTPESPYSVTQVLALQQAGTLSEDDTVYVTGKVVYSEFSEYNGDKIVLSDECTMTATDENSVAVYYPLSVEGNALAQGDVHVHDSVVVGCYPYWGSLFSDIPMAYHEQINVTATLTRGSDLLNPTVSFGTTDGEGIYYSLSGESDMQEWDGAPVAINATTDIYYAAYTTVNGCSHFGRTEIEHIVVPRGNGSGTINDPFDSERVLDIMEAQIDTVNEYYVAGYVHYTVTYFDNVHVFLTTLCNERQVEVVNARKSDGSVLTGEETNRGTYMLIHGRMTSPGGLVDWQIVTLERYPEPELIITPAPEGIFFDEPRQACFAPVPEGYTIYYTTETGLDVPTAYYSKYAYTPGSTFTIPAGYSSVKALVGRSIDPCSIFSTESWQEGGDKAWEFYVGMAGSGQGTREDPIDLERAVAMQSVYYTPTILYLRAIVSRCSYNYMDITNCDGSITQTIYANSLNYIDNYSEFKPGDVVLAKVAVAVSMDGQGEYILDNMNAPVSVATDRPAANLLVGDSLQVSLTAEGASGILYTTDGSDPTTNGVLYEGPLTLRATTTLRAVAYRQDGSCRNYGPETTKTYVFSTQEKLANVQYTYNNHTYTLHVDTTQVQVSFEPVPLELPGYGYEREGEEGGEEGEFTYRSLSNGEGYVLIRLNGSDEYTHDDLYPYEQLVAPKYEYQITMDGEDISNRGICDLNWSRSTGVAIREIAADHDITIHRVGYESTLSEDRVKVALRIDAENREDYEIILRLTDDYEAEPKTISAQDSAMVPRGADAALSVRYGAMLGMHYRIRINGVDVTNECSGEIFNGDYTQYWALHNIQQEVLIEVDELEPRGETITCRSSDPTRARLVMRDDEGEWVPYEGGDSIIGVCSMLYIELAPNCLLSSESDFHGFYRGGLHWHYAISNTIEFTNEETGYSYISLRELANNPMMDNMLQLTSAEITLLAYYSQSTEVTETVTEVSAEVRDNSVVITWPAVENTDTYVIRVYQDNSLYLTVVISSTGEVQSIDFADNAPAAMARRVRAQAAQAADELPGGWKYTLFGLAPNASYTYDITCYDAAEQTIDTGSTPMSGSFTTEDVPTSLDAQQADSETAKYMRNGQLYILRDGQRYNVLGTRIR